MLRSAIHVLTEVWSHPSNRGRRGRQVVRAVAFQLRGRVLKARTLTTFGHAKVWAEVGRTGTSRFVYADPPDPCQISVWQRRLLPGDLFLDIGANVGMYSIVAALRGASVIALEANAELIPLIEENLAVNNLSADVRCLAVAASEGEVMFEIDGDQRSHISVGAGRTVKATTIDAIVGTRNVAGIKIDVEGAERLVLEGASAALAEKRIECLQIEWNDASVSLLGESREPVERLLRSHGYELFVLDPLGNLVNVVAPVFQNDVFAMPVRQKSGPGGTG